MSVMLALTILLAGLYAVGLARLARRREGVSPLWQNLAGLGGFGCLVLLELPFFHELSHALFTMHMVAHILLAAVAAPLLVMARPMAPLLWSLPRGLRVAVGGLIATLARWRIHTVLTVPLVAVVVHAIALWAWHVPALYEAALEEPGRHFLQHASLFITALAFWSAALNPRQAGVGLLLLFVTLTHTGILGALLTFSTYAWYHVHAPEIWGLTALEDQQLAGLIMWVPASFIYLSAALWAGASLLREPPALRERQS